MKRKFGRCPHCARLIEITPTGSIKGIVALAGLAGLRVHPLIGIALGIAALIWGDEVETWIRARCPECSVALTIIGEVYG